MIVMFKLNVPTKSYVYYALCELSDAMDNVIELRNKVVSEEVVSFLDDVLLDLNNVYSKLEQFPF